MEKLRRLIMDFLYKEPQVINIFTDASTTNNSASKVLAACGFILVNQGQAKNKGFTIWKGSSSFGELYAAFMGINEIYRDAWWLRSQGYNPSIYRVYNLFTDSTYVLKTLKKWAIDWIKDAGPMQYEWNPCTMRYELHPPLLKKPDKDLVQHQELILQTVWVIISGQVKIHIYHTSAHKKSHKSKDMQKYKENFTKLNEFPKDYVIPTELMHELIKWNDSIDHMTRNGLNALLNNPMTREQILNSTKPIFPVRYYPTWNELMTYKYLVE